MSAFRQRLQTWAGQLDAALRAVDDEARATPRSRLLDLKMAIAVCLGAFSLAMVFQYGNRHRPKSITPVVELFGFDGRAWEALFEGYDGSYRRFVYWTTWVGLTYALLPFLYAMLMKPRVSLDELGLKAKGALQHWRVYVGLYLAILPLLLLVSQGPAFSSFYPMWRGALGSPQAFLMWQLAYLPQFFFVEFFFRGFLIFTFKPRLGSFAVLVPIIPYCMIHFAKPFPEVLGTIVANLVLGTVALLTRSIWLGVAVHITVAVTMDLLALYANGGFPS